MVSVFDRNLDAFRSYQGKLMTHARDAARANGKSDPIDSLAIVRAALREPNLRLDGVERGIRLLVDHREDLVAERAPIIARLGWHLHEIDPAWTLQRNSTGPAHSTESQHVWHRPPASSRGSRHPWSSTAVV